MIVRSRSQKLALAFAIFLLVVGLAWLPRLIAASPGILNVYTRPTQPILPNAPPNDKYCDVLQAHSATTDGLTSPSISLAALLSTLEVMQSHFYTIWQGQWPHAIDWTAAVMGTQVSATLTAMTETWWHRTSRAPSHPYTQEDQEHENTINRYFTQITSFYFGENAFSLRTQAYDDMLWVVLEWLEGVNFIKRHSALHYIPSGVPHRVSKPSSWNSTQWYGQQFVPQFAHRARVFYDLAAKGWSTSLCGGGMVWNPHLAPYKNAITNQLFISASVAMYLRFPGDDNASPFTFKNPVRPATGLPPARAHDPQYLENAVEAYQWLKTSGMTNSKGLYIDGFHIQGWRGGKNGSTGTGKCDLRNEQVYTYNQGVILSGLRGLWEATGSRSYLQDGHRLIQNVIAATGWDTRGTKWRWHWSGLGRNGVMEEACDSSGTCSQNGHTFKGIFFHHLALFCGRLPPTGFTAEDSITFAADDRLAAWHDKKCEGYGPWLRNNAQAAYLTRDNDGEFGTWWGIPAGTERRNSRSMGDEAGFEVALEDGIDYRNKEVPLDDTWTLPDDQRRQHWESRNGIGSAPFAEKQSEDKEMPKKIDWDPNNRGRGRTVETQSGGLAVLRALWNVVDSRRQ
ncbi:MAG: hypothetical protein LQ344_005984 [Seirophora lacunosa]|nr:MAG: hypothetical protein LQ344_005984 [Seirophora lacunosa]